MENLEIGLLVLAVAVLVGVATQTIITTSTGGTTIGGITAGGTTASSVVVVAVLAYTEKGLRVEMKVKEDQVVKMQFVIPITIPGIIIIGIITIVLAFQATVAILVAAEEVLFMAAELAAMALFV